MKKILVLILTIFSIQVFSQTASDVFDYKAMTFYGLDFTQARCIGSTEFPSGEEMKDVYFEEWNKLFMDEDLIRIGKPYKKKKVEYDSLILNYNREINPDDIVIDGSYSFKKSDIDKFTEKFTDSEKAGIGMVYLVEALNANEKYLSLWVIFFNNSTGEVLISEPLRSKGKGRKFEDYWYNAFIKLYMESAYDYKAWSRIYK